MNYDRLFRDEEPAASRGRAVDLMPCTDCGVYHKPGKAGAFYQACDACRMARVAAAAAEAAKKGPTVPMQSGTSGPA